MVRDKTEIRQTVERGEELYHLSIKHELTDDQLGLYLAIDVNTGEYEIGESSMSVTLELRDRVDNADVYVMRHGGMPVLTFGGYIPDSE